ncbi:MAG: LacI family DNA-binding transcriptional regulator [Spirochaetales bacterium]|nr:LacI family DNA-binding transcriptional regulator [Spirochaetales bacterium]
MSKKRVTGIRDIARLAGVSTATVSRVLNGNTSVDEALAEKVMHTAESLGYRPSPAARYMRSKTSGLLGIVVPKLSLAYFSSIVNGAIDKADEYGQMVVVGTVEGKSSTEKEFLIKLSNYMIDGLIYCPVAAGPFLEELEILRHLPLVIAGRRRVIQGMPHVSTNDEKAGYLATRYLLNLGRKYIGFFAGFWEKPPFPDYPSMIASIDTPLSGSFSTLDRLRGYRGALLEEGEKIQEALLIFCGFDAESGYVSSREIVGRLTDLDALIVPNCFVARGVYRFCQEQGIRIPEDISLISLDDSSTGELLATPTTAVVHDMYRVGVEAVERLNQVILGEEAQDKLIDVKLEIRQSTVQKTFT